MPEKEVFGHQVSYRCGPGEGEVRFWTPVDIDGEPAVSYRPKFDTHWQLIEWSDRSGYAYRGFYGKESVGKVDLEANRAAAARYRALAIEWHKGEDGYAFDPDAEVLQVEGGAHVAAWVWVPDFEDED